MFNEFGVPMSDAEISMQPIPGKAMLQQQLDASGLENQWIGAVVGAGIGIAGGIMGGSRSAAAAREQAEAQNRATQARYQYDMDMWDAKRSQMQAQRMEAVDSIMLEARNEGKVRAYKDAANEQQYQYALQIRNAQQASNEAAFERSDRIYSDTTDMNYLSAKAAMDSEIVKLEEAGDAGQFDRNQAYIDSIVAEGQLRARGASGRSASKAIQSTLADYGRQLTMLDATDDSAGRNTRAVLDEIMRDKTSADLTAYASKMLDPGVLPMPIKNRPIPVAEFSLPRALQEYDFGPQPVMGAMASPSAAANAVWGQTITSIGSAIGTGMSGIAGGLAGPGEAGAWINPPKASGGGVLTGSSIYVA